MRLHIRPLRLALTLALLALTAAPASATFTVSGTIKDLGGTAIQNIRVRIYDEDVTFDALLDTVYTNAAGAYSSTLTGGWGPIETEPDVYILVDWFFPFAPSGTYGGHHMILGQDNSTSTAFTPKSSSVDNDHDPSVNLPGKDLTMNQTPAGTPDTLRLHVNEALDYYMANKGTVTFELTEDPIANLDPTTIVSTASHDINIAVVDINGTNNPAAGGQGFISDIYHEMGHWTHYRMNGGGVPSSPLNGSSHSFNSEKDAIFAEVEGWGNLMGVVTDALHAHDAKYDTAIDPGNNLWRGDEGPDTGRDAGAFESGEIIEGALAASWYAIQNDACCNFSDILRVFVVHKPQNMSDFAKGMVSDVGSGSAKAKQMYTHMATHGIVFTRERLQSDPFDVSAPPNVAPSPLADGNKKEIDGFLFLRGKVKTKVEPVPTSDLGVATAVDVDKASIGWKAAADDLAGTPTGLAGTTPTASVGNSAGSIDVDTKTFGGTAGDGDWDLLSISENKDGFTDTFLPTWVGDPTASVNSDEKYGKVVGSWYDKDRDPSTNTAKEGKVVVDNTAPTVDAMTFKPK